MWIRDDRQRLVCEAHLVEKTRWAGESAMEDAREKSRRGKLARLERKAEEINGRHKPLLPAAEQREVDAEQVVAFREMQAIEANEVEQLQMEECPDQRFRRAMRLEAAERLDEADARWLAIYQTSPEYHSRRALHDEFGGNQQ